MLSLIKRYRDLILVAGLLLFPFFTFMTRGPRGRDPWLLDRAVLSISSSLQRAFSWVIDGTASVWSGYAALRGVERENRALREENQQLKARAQAMDQLSAENGRLRELLDYRQKSAGAPVAARVVGVDPSSTRHYVRIDRGEADGVAAGMAVVTPAGAAGYVERATSGWADVILLTDAGHRMGVRIGKDRRRAIAAGTGRKDELDLRLDYALRKDDLQDGDVVVTSGTDGVYPPDLPVGVVTKMEKRSVGMFQAGFITPAVNPTTLDEVLVLPKVTVPPPVSAPGKGEAVPANVAGGAGVP